MVDIGARHQQHGLKGGAVGLQRMGRQRRDAAHRQRGVELLGQHPVAQVAIGHQAHELAVLHQQHGRDALLAHVAGYLTNGRVGRKADRRPPQQCANGSGKAVEAQADFPGRFAFAMRHIRSAGQRGEVVFQRVVRQAQPRQFRGRQPGHRPVGSRRGLPGGEMARRRGAKAKQLAALQAHGLPQVRVQQIHRASHHHAQAAEQTALGQEQQAFAGALMLPLRGKIRQYGGVQRPPDAVAGQQGLKIFGRRRGGIHGADP